MGFRLVPKSVTLNDLERRIDGVLCVISPNSVAVGPYYVKVVEDTPILSASEMQPEESTFSAVYHLWRYSKGITPSEGVKVQTWKRCEIEGQLLLMTNRKSYMGFRLVPKSVIVNDRERCNGHYFALFRGIRQVSWPVSYKVDQLLICCLSPDKCHKVHQLSTTDALCSSRQRNFLLVLVNQLFFLNWQQLRISYQNSLHLLGIKCLVWQWHINLLYVTYNLLYLAGISPL